MLQQRVPARAESVVIGRQDYTSTVLRLIGMELYKIRRRTMSKILIVIALISIFFVFAGILTIALEAHLDRMADLLRLPDSLNMALQTALTPFTLLIIILIGTATGGEYSQGTVRLLFTRGPSRTQFLLAKIITALICSIIGILMMVIFGVLLGFVFSFAFGAPSFAFLSPGWVVHAILYVLLAILNWFIFAVIAIFFSVLGRSTVAGVVGGIVWFLLEPVVSSIFQILGNAVQGPAGDSLKAVPDYLIGNNISALLQNQEQYLLGNGTPAALSDTHAILVLAAYLVIFISLAWWLNKWRDVTN